MTLFIPLLAVLVILWMMVMVHEIRADAREHQLQRESRVIIHRPRNLTEWSD